VVGAAEHHDPVLPVPGIIALTLIVVAVGAVWAWMRYAREEVPEVAPVGSWGTRAARADLYQEEINQTLFEKPGVALTRGLDFADRSGVDGTIGGVSGWIAAASRGLRRVQNGLARSYALTMLSGVVLFLGAVWVMQ
ncbi:MAG: NADH-quinone oxidoreductase subunit L, partial [Intrasporangiaceae bacterium]|nr:NADH-quinone oxidoreductase subunit L [Intrasporangiaceae bacterium]